MGVELVGVTEIANRLKLTSERVRQLGRSGQLPPPAGSLGRQDIWRWEDVAVWAAAVNRLPVEAANGRQSVAAWLPGSGGRRRLVIDSIETWGPRARGIVHVRIWERTENSPAVMLLGNLEDNKGPSVTNRIEDVTMEVGARLLGSETATAQIYEHWAGDHRHAATFHHVTFKVVNAGRTWRQRDRSLVRQVGGEVTEPHWRETNRAEIEALVGDTVKEWTAGTYTSELVRAARHSPDGRIGAFWDPEYARAAAAAHQHLRQLAVADMQVREHLLRVLAHHAVSALDAAGSDVRAQDPDAAIWLVAPEIPEHLKIAAQSLPSPSAPDLWAALTWTRTQLAGRTEEERRGLVPAIRGGLARLPWYEAGNDEADDDTSFGRIRPIAAPADLLTNVGEWEAPDPLRAAEFVLVATLAKTGDIDKWDLPARRPSGPYRTAGPIARRYLEGVLWETQQGAAFDDVDQADAVYRLRAQLTDHDAWPAVSRAEGKAAFGQVIAGRDPAGNIVIKTSDNTWFCIDWPFFIADDLASAATRIQADAPTNDNTPVFVECGDGQLVPLPGVPADHRTHEYTWGYSGAGPSNLREAVVQLLQAVAKRDDESFRDAATASVREHVSRPQTPNWNLRELVEPLTRARKPRRAE